MIAIVIRMKNFQDCHFIRCIKPNGKSDKTFDDVYVLEQLRSSGSIAYNHLMRVGYPTHIVMEVLYQTFEPYKFQLNDAKTICKSFLYSIGFKTSDFKFGNSKLFLRPGKRDILNRFLESDPIEFELIIKNMKAFIIKSRLKSLFYIALYYCKGLLSFVMKTHSELTLT